MTTISCEQGGRAATHGSGTWVWRLLLMIVALALVWLFAFVAESRADDVATAQEEMSDVFDPDSSTAAEPTQPGDQTSPTQPGDEAEPTPPGDQTEPTPPGDQTEPTPPAEETPPVDQTPPPVDQTPPTPPVDQTPPPVDQTPPTPPVDQTPPVATPPAETPAPSPPTANPHPAIHDSSSAVNPFAPTSSSVTTGDTWIPPDPIDLLGTLGAAPVTAAGAGGTSRSDVATDQSDAQEPVSPGPSPLFPWTPRQDKPFGGFGGGGIFGGSTGGGGGGAPMVLAAFIGLFALAQLFGSRLSTATKQLCGAAPAFQLKRPG